MKKGVLDDKDLFKEPLKIGYKGVSFEAGHDGVEIVADEDAIRTLKLPEDLEPLWTVLNAMSAPSTPKIKKEDFFGYIVKCKKWVDTKPTKQLGPWSIDLTGNKVSITYNGSGQRRPDKKTGEILLNMAEAIAAEHGKQIDPNEFLAAIKTVYRNAMAKQRQKLKEAQEGATA